MAAHIAPWPAPSPPPSVRPCVAASAGDAYPSLTIYIYFLVILYIYIIVILCIPCGGRRPWPRGPWTAPQGEPSSENMRTGRSRAAKQSTHGRAAGRAGAAKQRHTWTGGREGRGSQAWTGGREGRGCQAWTDGREGRWGLHTSPAGPAAGNLLQLIVIFCRVSHTPHCLPLNSLSLFSSLFLSSCSLSRPSVHRRLGNATSFRGTDNTKRARVKP